MPSQRFRPSQRLGASGEIRRLFGKGLSANGGWVVLKGLPRASGESRFGVIVAKKVFPSGVDRNRIKRWFKEAFRRHQSEFLPPVDLVILVKDHPAKLSYSLVEETLLLLRKKLESRRGLSS